MPSTLWKKSEAKIFYAYNNPKGPNMTINHVIKIRRSSSISKNHLNCIASPNRKICIIKLFTKSTTCSNSIDKSLKNQYQLKLERVSPIPKEIWEKRNKKNIGKIKITIRKTRDKFKNQIDLIYSLVIA